MTSQAFRNSMDTLGWSRRTSEAPVDTSRSPLLSKLQQYNPFNTDGRLRLPTDAPSAAPLPAPSRQEEEEGWFALSRWDRILIFAFCNIGAAICFIVCFVLFPVLTLKPRKFAILWSMGSMLFLASWTAMMGPLVYARHLISGNRLPFTVAYFGSIAMTLYFAIGLRSTILTLLSSIIQMACLMWYSISYFPLGSTGLKFATQFGVQRASAWINT